MEVLRKHPLFVGHSGFFVKKSSEFRTPGFCLLCALRWPDDSVYGATFFFSFRSDLRWILSAWKEDYRRR